MAQGKFDDSKVSWFTLPGIDDLWYHILEIDEKSRTVDILFKFSANKKIVLHRHKVPYRTFVIQGELRLYNARGELTEIRGTGSYVSKPAGGAPHTEGGGDQDVVALFSNREVEGPVYEILDGDLNVISTLGLPEFKALYEAQFAAA